MGRINLYISEKDKPFYDEALELLGENSLSTIVKALEITVKQEKEKKEGFEDVELEIGQCGREGYNLINIRFKGKKLAFFRELRDDLDSRDNRGTDYTLYLSRKGKFLLHWYEWSRSQNEYGHMSYVIVDYIDKLEKPVVVDECTVIRVPDQLIREAKKALPTIELDI